VIDIPDWLLSVFGDVTLAQVVIWVAILCAAVWLVRKIWPGLRAAMKLTDMLAQLPTFMEQTRSTLVEQDAMLERLRKQVENGHSTNLRDELTETVESARELSTSLEGIHGRLDDMQSQLAGVQRKLTKDNDRIQQLEDSQSRDDVDRIRTATTETENHE
jgi:hypothetical protein